MEYYKAALTTELLKIIKSKMIWITLAALTLGPLMSAFFMFVLKNPDLAESSGLLGAKAEIAGEANWPSLLSMLAQIIAVGGVIVFGFITSWAFGREYTDETIKDLIALPFPRWVIIVAKFTAVFITCIVFSIYVFALGILLGSLIQLPGLNQAVMAHGLYQYALTALFTIALSTPVAFFASYGRGYLAPLGFIIIMVLLSQIIGAIGYGDYFPWAIPALFSGMTGVESPLKVSSTLIILSTCLIGLYATFSWWKNADQH
ncbi:ABC transporter permease [Halobacillus salinarum]|uniref:ABC transporter permease n=1 Tax=Halobacillus salinarum TaxID=2932257 RepID=A0ABY4EHN3_9BACI|nr:ABC transporter permease [Halobacillus salinarum]UOQ43636.1 ABC transporter permease [Halobacillus salinarum]